MSLLLHGMINHMETETKRTTLILQSMRLVDLKQLAAERGQTISAVVDEFLADGIRRARMAQTLRPSLPVFDMGEPRVDINSREAIEQAIGDDDLALYR